jgi:hypothetical protein
MVIGHHHNQFASPTSANDVLLITTGSPYEVVVKTVFTASLLYDMTVTIMMQYNKIHNIFK